MFANLIDVLAAVDHNRFNAHTNKKMFKSRRLAAPISGITLERVKPSAIKQNSNANMWI